MKSQESPRFSLLAMYFLYFRILIRLLHCIENKMFTYLSFMFSSTQKHVPQSNVLSHRVHRIWLPLHSLCLGISRTPSSISTNCHNWSSSTFVAQSYINNFFHLRHSFSSTHCPSLFHSLAFSFFFLSYSTLNIKL
ncbi:hypothetical protein V8G54_030576 [Vigna mungo]|uniref:Uncharacterized protein n=1 Tax=Vigna mungo TaxID=3915 RepID=A0AAQ3RNR7_VIGMU